jgi:hypothetical protein
MGVTIALIDGMEKEIVAPLDTLGEAGIGLSAVDDPLMVVTINK